MKKILIFILITCSYFKINAQTSFKKGYFINNTGERVECYIEILDIFYTPKMFNYKTSKESKKMKAFINEVTVFEIYGTLKYERKNVTIDRSSEIINEISASRKAIFNTEQLFLKVLIEGKSSLYQYNEPNLNRFFFKKDNSKIEQLVFKSYSDGFSNNIKKNERYKQQLFNSLQCEYLKKEKFNNLDYKKSKLTNIFIEYNKCKETDYKDYSLENNKKLKTQFNLNLKIGGRLIDFFVDPNTFFESKLTTKFGIEAEVVLPFNKNKWSLIAEPNYLYYNANYIEGIGNSDNSSKINYSAIDIPIGLRYYIFLNNKNSKFFINAFIVPNFTVQLKTISNNDDSNILVNNDSKSNFNRAFGIGYKYKEKLSAEFRVSGGTRELFNIENGEQIFLFTSLILGYTLF